MWLLEESKYENWFSKFKKSMELAFSFWIIWIPLPVLSEENIFTGSSLLPLIEKGLYDTIAALLIKSIDSPFFNCTLKLTLGKCLAFGFYRTFENLIVC